MAADLDDRLKEVVQRLPDSPGVYKFLNTDGILIYIGKAKSIKKTLSIERFFLTLA